VSGTTRSPDGADAVSHVARLPFIDEHCVDVAASPDDVWPAVVETFGDVLSAPLSRMFARIVGADPREPREWNRTVAGSSVTGFRVVEAVRPRRLVLAGRHRFAEYAVVITSAATDTGTRCCLESRAAFPGVHGRLYRIAVLGSHGHVVAVRRLLRTIRGRAETAPDAGRVVSRGP
jgi:hypothetical protein